MMLLVSSSVSYQTGNWELETNFMAKNNNIVHQYFKKELEGTKILVKLNPIHLTGTELTIEPKGTEMRELEFDGQIFDDLKEDGFLETNGMEFNLYLAGLL
jgi:hypothetical protein